MKTSEEMQRTKMWNICLWIAQGILAAMFLTVGFMKIATPIEELSKIVPLAKDAPDLIRFIGMCELLGGLGLILPAMLKVKPHLTTLAAFSLVVLMLLALVFHLIRGEISAIGTNIVLGMLAVFIVWGRSKKAVIAAKGTKQNELTSIG
jgi:uncharacterized membrane protein